MKEITFLHGMHTVTERKGFKIRSTFESWKEVEEARCNSCFVRPAGKKVEVAKDGKCVRKVVNVVIIYYYY